MSKEETIAEFIGIMLGDGSIGIYKTKAGNKIKIHRRVKVTLDSRNIQYSNYVAGIMKEVLGVSPKINYKKNENTVDVSIFKKDIVDYVLNHLGLKISPKFGRMEIPVANTKGKLGLFVLKGLFDTDGCVSLFNNNGKIYPRIEIRICPSPAQNQVLQILKDSNFKYKIQKLNKGHIKIRLNGINELNKWFKLIGSSNSIHIEKAKKFISVNS